MSGSLKTKETTGNPVTLDGVLKYVMDSASVTAATDAETKKRFSKFFERVQFKGVNHTD